MLKRLAAILLAFALTACAQLSARYELEDLAKAQVLVADGVVIVTQEPLVVRRPKGVTSGEDTVAWDIGTTGLQFATKDAVTIDARVKPTARELTAELRKQLEARPLRDTSQIALTKCTTNEARTSTTCTLPRALRAGSYAYTLRLVKDGSPLELDPTIYMSD